jgi:hypothetical protein
MPPEIIDEVGCPTSDAYSDEQLCQLNDEYMRANDLHECPRCFIHCEGGYRAGYGWACSKACAREIGQAAIRLWRMLRAPKPF